MEDNVDLQELGISKEELTERLVETMANKLMTEKVPTYDPDTEEEYEDEEPTPFAQEIHKLLVERINAKVCEVAERHVLPRIDQMIENLILQETNQWGEKRGKAVTFVEYMVQRGEAYLSEHVNRDGKSQKECGGYSWSDSHQTRLTHMVHKYMHHTIETAMKESVGTVMKSLSTDLAETAKLKLQEISKGLQVTVALPR